MIFNGDGRGPLIISHFEISWSPWNFAGLMFEIFLEPKYGKRKKGLCYIYIYIEREREREREREIVEA